MNLKFFKVKYFLKVNSIINTIELKYDCQNGMYNWICSILNEINMEFDILY